MHQSAMDNAAAFFKTYLPHIPRPCRVVEIGSQDVNGSPREVCPADVEYIGVDLAPGKGVDLVVDDPYRLPFDANAVDVCICSSVLEHTPLFWLLFQEMLRVLRPHGLLYLNVPSNGPVHRFPVDCWRFYPDCGDALAEWGRRCGYAPAVLESYVSAQSRDVWNDFVAVFVRDQAYAPSYPARILHSARDAFNGRMLGAAEVVRPAEFPEDMLKLRAIGDILGGRLKIR